MVGSSRFIIFFIVVNLSLISVSSQAVYERAAIPPRGWNSYDSFCWIISEQDFLKTAEIVVEKLKSFGYEYVVLDYLWYRKNVDGSGTDASGFDVIDEWGRLQPDPDRWPSSVGGKGLSLVAKRVHDMGLKFGFHVMAGISKQAYDANTLILDPDTGYPYEEDGREWRTQDIGLKEKACAWMPNGFMSVDTTLGAGRAFLKSLYHQYFDWGVDFIKHDCVFGDDFNLGEITVVSQFLEKSGRPVIYSLSPGKNATPKMAQEVNALVNMYRITADDWDSWNDVLAHFDVARDMAASNMIGASGLRGRSWPDLDMLPLGWLTDPNSNRGPYRPCKLTPDEQKTQMTLWSIARSPLMFGGDVRNLDNDTLYLITNPTLMEINAVSSNNKEFPFVTAADAGPAGVRSWIATRDGGEIYIAFFNLNDKRTEMTAKISDLAKALPDKKLEGTSCEGEELWSRNIVGPTKDSVSMVVEPHGTVLFTLHCKA